MEPAQTDTDLWRNADETVERAVAALSDEHRVLYDKHITGMRKGVRLSQKLAAPVEGVAAVIEKALTTSRPRARYVVGTPARVQASVLPFDAGPGHGDEGRLRGTAQTLTDRPGVVVGSSLDDDKAPRERPCR